MPHLNVSQREQQLRKNDRSSESSRVNTHAWLNQSNLSANCTGCEQQRRSVCGRGSDVPGSGRREIQMPICAAPSLRSHQKGIWRGGEQPREIVSRGTAGNRRMI